MAIEKMHHKKKTLRSKVTDQDRECSYIRTGNVDKSGQGMLLYQDRGCSYIRTRDIYQDRTIPRKRYTLHRRHRVITKTYTTLRVKSAESAKYTCVCNNQGGVFSERPAYKQPTSGATMNYLTVMSATLDLPPQPHTYTHTIKLTGVAGENIPLVEESGVRSEDRIIFGSFQ